jgi:hypothetical protein
MTNFSVGKSLNRSTGQALHEGRGVGVQVVRAGGVEAGVAAGADVDHGRDVVLDHLLVDGVPVRSLSGGLVQWPPDGSGFRLMATLPYCSTHFTSSGMQVAGSTPGLCGSMAAGMK